MEQETAIDFYDRLVQGKEYTETITLEHKSGATLKDVRMKPVDKKILANVIEKLPEEIFDAVETAENPEEAEEMLDDDVSSIGAMSSGTVEAFEDLCVASLSHEELTQTQMEQIIEELDFGVLFELGGQIIDISFADGAAIKDFREQG